MITKFFNFKLEFYPDNTKLKQFRDHLLQNAARNKAFGQNHEQGNIQKSRSKVDSVEVTTKTAMLGWSRIAKIKQ
jgi:hypothetical protein